MHVRPMRILGRRRGALAVAGFVQQLVSKLRGGRQAGPEAPAGARELPGRDAPYRLAVRRECCWTAVAREIASSHPLGPPPPGAAPGGLPS